MTGSDTHGGRPGGRDTRVRYWVVLGVALASASAYLTRVCLATANTTIQREFGFSSEVMGQVLAAFSIGYFWFQVPGGWLCNRWGCRIILPLFSLLWSLSSVWTGMAHSLAALWNSRLGLGLMQAGLVPCSARALVDWSPPASRGLFSSAIATSMSVGAVISSGLTALLLPALGWRGVFLAYSGVGIVWSAAFYAGFRDRPEEHPAVSSEERRLIRAGESGGQPAAPKERARDVLLAMATSSSMWAICSQAFCRAFGAAFFITWFPAYLEKGRGVQLTSAGLMTMLPLAGIVAGNTIGGVLVDRLLARTGRKRLSRSGTAVCALALTALCTLLAAATRNTLGAVLVMSVGSLFSGVGSPAAWAATMDISGRHTAVVFGIMNMAGNLGAFVCPLLLGYLIGHIERTAGDWNLVLYVFVAIYALGALFWSFLDPERSAVTRDRRASALT